MTTETRPEMALSHPSDAAAEGVRGGWAMVAVGFLGLMLGPAALLTMTFGVLAAGLEAQTGWTHSAVAYASTLASLAILVTSPIQGVLTDRLGGRRLILMSLPAFGASLLLFGLAPTSIGAFYAIFTLAAVAGMGLWPGPFMKVVSGWFDRRLGIAFGIMTTALGVSVSVIPLVFRSSFATLGWSTTYMLAGGVILAVVLPAAWRWLREAPPAHGRPEGPRAATGIGPLLVSRAFWIALVTFLALGMANAAILVHGVANLKAAGLPVGAALKIQALVGIGSIVGRLGTGILLDRLDVRAVGAAMFVLAAVYFLVLAQPIAGALPLAAVCGGLVVGAEFNVLGILVRRYLPLPLFGSAYGIGFAAFHLGGAIGSGTLAFLLSRSGSMTEGLWVLLGVSLGCGLLFALVGRPPAARREEPA